MWRAALAAGSPDTTHAAFEQAVRRESERMLEEGAPLSAVAAFQSAVADMQSAMELEARSPARERGDE
jgi:hypothetical protein